ncbi:unnamed protein product [Ectocarpus sp. CCAP 1310/34]|nr:unnamed protein product [Ectocarpus sp. CCAP 1310/34]
MDVVSLVVGWRRRRFSEVSFIKELEAEGVGRPSTYASIIGTLRTRTYVNLQGRSLTPSLTGFVVVDLLWGHFPDFTDIGFTAKRGPRAGLWRAGAGARRKGEKESTVAPKEAVAAAAAITGDLARTAEGWTGTRRAGAAAARGGAGRGVVVATVGVRGGGGSGGSRRGFGPR